MADPFLILKDVGLPEWEQRLIHIHTWLRHLATKEDVARLEKRLDELQAEIRAELRALRR